MLFGGTLWFTSCTDWLFAFASTLLQNTWVGLLGRTNEFFQAIGFYIFFLFFLLWLWMLRIGFCLYLAVSFS
jgi:hypothetical protein